MPRLILRLLINAAAIWVAASVVDGVYLDTSHPLGVAVVALVFGLVNAGIKPLLRLLSLPFVLLTLGLFTLVINGILFALTAWLTQALRVDGLGPAVWGALVTSLVSWLLGVFVDDKGRASSGGRA